ncbi:hypothetical protein QJQ45_008971 [Haematococcus lacustris]|nr:hypothetical protein QJQ45_008971 [Haematococcus lacustris]
MMAAMELLGSCCGQDLETLYCAGLCLDGPLLQRLASALGSHLVCLQLLACSLHDSLWAAVGGALPCLEQLSIRFAGPPEQQLLHGALLPHTPPSVGGSQAGQQGPEEGQWGAAGTLPGVHQLLLLAQGLSARPGEISWQKLERRVGGGEGGPRSVGCSPRRGLVLELRAGRKRDAEQVREVVRDSRVLSWIREVQELRYAHGFDVVPDDKQSSRDASTWGQKRPRTCLGRGALQQLSMDQQQLQGAKRQLTLDQEQLQGAQHQLALDQQQLQGAKRQLTLDQEQLQGAQHQLALDQQ